METEDTRAQEIRKAFLQYAKENELPSYATTYYLAKQFLQEDNLFLKMEVIRDLTESGILVQGSDKWRIKN